MTAFTTPKKRKLNKGEVRDVAALNYLIKGLKKNYGIHACKDYNPGCPNCILYITLGHLESLKADIEY